MTSFKNLATALALCAAGLSTAVAQEASFDPAGANKDGFVSRQEFLDQMGKVWDEGHARMMKSDKKMRPGMMDRGQYSTFRGQMSETSRPNPDPGKNVGGAPGR